MASKTEICNLALSHIGIGKEIANIETERSPEASACKRFYETARQMVLRAVDWPFATRFAELGLVEEDPTAEWAYSYRVPAESLKIRRILSGIRNDTRQSRIPYRQAQDDSGLLIYTDMEDAVMEYTHNTDDVALFSHDFVMAFSFLLGSLVAPRITGGDPFKLGDKARAIYLELISQSASHAFNEQQDEEEPDSEFIRVRE